MGINPSLYQQQLTCLQLLAEVMCFFVLKYHIEIVKDVLASA